MDYLCQDCQSVLGILSDHQKFQTQNLNDLYFAVPYQKPLVKNLIRCFKYEPFVKELAETLSSLIISHFQLLDNKPDFSGFILIPVPLGRKRLKWRGFNQVEEIAKFLSQKMEIPLLKNCLLKNKQNLPQIELTGEKRLNNIKGVFNCKNPEVVKGKQILLVDDVYTTGATMEECAKVLKKAGTKEVIGVVVSRAKPEEDRFQII